jgi:hypothetical protein
MVVSGNRLGYAAAMLVLAASTGWTQDPAEPPPADMKPASARRTNPSADSPPKPASPTAGPRTTEADFLSVPADAILVICKEVKDALRLMPEGVVLTPEKYKALMEKIDQLERQIRTPPTEVPSTCRLTGQVEADVVRFQAQFDIRTERPRAVVALGCQRAWLKPGATLDGHLPLLLAGEDGQIKVHVDTPGVHQLTLELETPLGAKGAKGLEQGIDFGLPRAAITTLEQLTLPRQVAEVRLNGWSVRTKAVDAQHSRLAGIPLGPADRLEMSWKGLTSAAKKVPPVLEALGRISVRVTEAHLITDVDLTLQALGGETRQWRIHVPPQVVPELKEPRLQDERIDSIDLPDARSRFLNIRLREASSEALRVQFQVRQARTKAPVPIGPYIVQGALRQRGTIGLSAPGDLRLRYHVHGDVIQREVSDERRDNFVAEFTYVHLPSLVTPSQAVPAPLEVQVEEVKGTVEARVEHALLLTGQDWQVNTKILVTPYRTKLDKLEVDLPPAPQYEPKMEAGPPDLVDGVEILDKPPRRVAQIKLIKEQSQPFTVTLPGLYTLGKGVQHVSVELPRPLQTVDRGGQVTVTLPEGIDLVSAGSGPEGPVPWHPVAGASERQHAWRSDRFPTEVSLVWRAHRPELPVKSVIDVFLTGRQARVRHSLTLPLSQPPAKQLSLVIPAPLEDRLTIEKGGTLEESGKVHLDPPARNEQTLVLSYSIPLPESDAGQPSRSGGESRKDRDDSRGFRQAGIPLVGVAEATRAETKVRVWSDPALLPSLARGPWEERPTEIVRGQDTLPALVLRSSSLNPVLSLRLGDAATSSLAPIIIDHALIHVILGEGGYQQYRARFLVSRLNTRELDVEFPAPLGRSNPQLFLDGKKLTRLQPLSTNQQENEGRTLVRVEVDPDLYSKPVILEIRYQLPPPSWGSPWFATLTPPLLRREAFLGRIRWQVELPSGWVSLYPGGGTTPEQRWVWRGLLLTPRPARTSADLEPWFTGESAQAAVTGDDAPAAAENEPGLICWQNALGPVPLAYAPQPVWLLVCSLFFLLLGLGLSFAPVSRPTFWLLVVVVSLTLGIAAFWRPSVVPAVVYGCEPGFLVLMLILAIQWLLQQRYRRQVVFLPGFTRLKPGSSMIRRDANPPRGEPSTVDAPAKRESSLQQAAEQKS